MRTNCLKYIVDKSILIITHAHLYIPELLLTVNKLIRLY